MDMDDIRPTNPLRDIPKESKRNKNSMSECERIGKVSIVANCDACHDARDSIGRSAQPMRASAVCREYFHSMSPGNQALCHFIGAARLSAVSPGIVKVWNDEDNAHLMRPTLDPVKKPDCDALPIVVPLRNSKGIPSKLVQARPV
jgi:hypothetical protein